MMLEALFFVLLCIQSEAFKIRNLKPLFRAKPQRTQSLKLKEFLKAFLGVLSGLNEQSEWARD